MLLQSRPTPLVYMPVTYIFLMGFSPPANSEWNCCLKEAGQCKLFWEIETNSVSIFRVIFFFKESLQEEGEINEHS